MSISSLMQVAHPASPPAAQEAKQWITNWPTMYAIRDLSQIHKQLNMDNT